MLQFRHMNKEENIVLIGFMGSGKSHVSRILAEKLKREVLATDEMIESSEGRSIKAIFDESGEAYFRDVETRVVAQAAARKGVIIDCGGGVVLREENIDALKKSGRLFFLSASPACLYEQVNHSGHRPLLDVENPLVLIEELLEARLPHYHKADEIIDADYKSVDEIAQQVLQRIEKHT